jgi:hypothetical protein
MTNLDFDAWADDVRRQLDGMKKKPLAFAVMILPDDPDVDMENPRLLAAIGTMYHSDMHRRTLIEGLFILAERLDEAYPPPIN